MGLTLIYTSLLALASNAVAQKCPIVFDGRVPDGTTPSLFDTEASPFNTEYVKGKEVAFSELIKIPDVPTSLFDAPEKSEAIEVTISDLSIFAPSPDNVQVGFRRAELQVDGNNGTDSSTIGVKTLHFSVRKDPARPFNNSHEYQLVWLEDNSYSTNQIVLKTGYIWPPTGLDPDTLVLFGNVNSKPVPQLFNTSFTEDVWHNFGVTMDFTASTTTVYYSTDSDPLALVNGPVANDVSGQGQFHFGPLKKPTGEGIKDVTKEGYQSPGIDEGVIFGAIFMEDSEGDCVSLSPDGSSTQSYNAVPAPTEEKSYQPTTPPTKEKTEEKTGEKTGGKTGGETGEKTGEKYKQKSEKKYEEKSEEKGEKKTECDS
ncbi:uncharacterized protein L3040_005073 [Drepanopeziza brunnea f. sp. 'multigermtubi']|uniref:Glycoside hydrolase 131 catalytic N-terminal domain-containing protein n=1 Tax=Marssonina brunnea f. sp. multigermtubi (strain MB_m1) TaxID=1072389 RepID=K1WIJ1_MARBU|nr:uncharacterized protein MBM_04331 [Drepanopeziza brunnea f. sp. 'multigermtubi' MB_m1]EKD17470.1 hypothetical protein MBM_04331 [Drepanopeziza brunnea f. sp. 'multigermtubi' MB_m1]KAJ5042530.1 hypothetical protein L3040_005073 [Drepanopeziza brunnea f. sp. 'multigermtubi']